MPGRLALTSPAPFGREARDRLDPFFFFPFFFLPAPFERGIEASLLSPPVATIAKTKTKQLQTVDRSAPASMKNAANCVNQCELQDTLIIDVSNAHGGPGSLPGPRPVEGRLLPKRDFAVHSAFRTVPRVPRGTRGRFRARTTRARSGRGFFPSASVAGSWRSVFAVRLSGSRRRRGALLSTLRCARSFSRPQLGRDDPLNLSILLRGGKENNDDSLSKGD